MNLRFTQYLTLLLVPDLRSQGTLVLGGLKLDICSREPSVRFWSNSSLTQNPVSSWTFGVGSSVQEVEIAHNWTDHTKGNGGTSNSNPNPT
jgi:hypothetical protein